MAVFKTYAEWSNRKKKKTGGNTQPYQNTLAQQVESRRVQKDGAQARLKDAQTRYESFMNQQTDTDQYDFLETGGVPSDRLQMEQEILWKNFVKAQTDANQAQKSYNDLLDAYTTQMANAERERYESMDIEDLNALKENQAAVVERNQAAAMEAQNNYGQALNQNVNTDYIDFLEGGAVASGEEKARQQALLQNAYAATDTLTDSRESYHLMEDTYNYRYDTQLISEMTEAEKIALALYSNGLDVTENIRLINSLTSEQRAQLRKTGRYMQILTDPEAYLKHMGYGNENLNRLAETYIRSQNDEKMEQLQQKARSIGDNTPILGTISTYPAKLVGKVTGGLAALDSGIKHTLGLSHYHGVDVNKPGYALSVYTDAVRDSVSEDFTDSGKALYNGVNYLVDEIASEVALKGFSKLTDLDDIDDAIDILSAYGDTVRNTAVSGGTTNESLGLGTASASIGWLTSKISVDELLKTKSFEDWTPLAKIAAEGTGQIAQEDLNYIGNLVMQTAILAEDSDFYRQVEALVQTGVSEEEAKKQVYAQYCGAIENASAWAFVRGIMRESE